MQAATLCQRQPPSDPVYQLDGPQPLPAYRGAWSIILPFHNEAGVLAATIASLAAQRERPFVILVDNGSTDESARVALTRCAEHGLDHHLIVELSPGKVAALAAGLEAVQTPYVATCDADTRYPPHYLVAAGQLLRAHGAVAAGAYFVHPEAGRWRRALSALRWIAPAQLLPWQCHTGGAGQAFRTEILRAAGGFDIHRWNFVLEDHEIAARMMAHGRMVYGGNFWCAPSLRKRDRGWSAWTLKERLAYHFTSRTGIGRFFEHYLGPRLAARGLTSDRLREGLAAATEEYRRGAPHSLCG